MSVASTIFAMPSVAGRGTDEATRMQRLAQIAERYTAAAAGIRNTLTDPRAAARNAAPRTEGGAAAPRFEERPAFQLPSAAEMPQAAPATAFVARAQAPLVEYPDVTIDIQNPPAGPGHYEIRGEFAGASWERGIVLPAIRDGFIFVEGASRLMPVTHEPYKFKIAFVPDIGKTRWQAHDGQAVDTMGNYSSEMLKAGILSVSIEL
jgi:hypothetical protein